MRQRPDQKILQSVNDLVAAVTQLVSNVATNAGTASRRVVAEARGVVRQAAAPATQVAEKSKRLRAAIRAHWASMTPKERADRVKRMLAGRGLKPLAGRKAVGREPGRASAGGDGAKSARLRTAVKAHWASMSPKARAERVKKMLAGRGLKPKG